MDSKGVTFKALIIGLILIPANSYWIIQMEVVDGRVFSTTSSLLFNVIFCLFVLTLLNLLFRKIFPIAALNQSELCVVYVMLCMGSAISGQGLLQVLISTLGHPFWFATPENEWRELFFRYIPNWLAVEDKSVLEGYYSGNSSLYISEHIKAWVIPAASWTAFMMLLVFVMVCINVVFRKQWIEQERLAYPIIHLPYEMTKTETEGEQFFKNRFLWLGFSGAFGFGIINGLHSIYPIMPHLPNIYSISQFFTEKPWNAISSEGMYLCFYPIAIGLGFFIPLDLSFSCWFFYLFWKLELVIGSASGLRSLPEFPYPDSQASGAYVGLGIAALWITRRHLAKVVNTVFSGKSHLENKKEEQKNYRLAILGIVVGFSLLTLFSYKSGMSVEIIVLFFAVYFTISIAITRMRAELGPLVHELYNGGAGQIIATSIGTRRINPRSLTFLSFLWGITRSHNNNPMPHQLEGFKLAERTRIDNRKLLIAIMIASIVGIISFFWLILHSLYQVGESVGTATHLQSFGNEAFSRLQRWLYYPSNTDSISLVFMIVGLTFSFFLMAMRRRFIWWPFHPLGYAVTQGDWAIKWLWFPLLISWMIKKAVLKYGGIKAYQKAVPLFLGLILGDCIIGGLWSLAGLMTGIPTYAFKNW